MDAGYGSVRARCESMIWAPHEKDEYSRKGLAVGCLEDNEMGKSLILDPAPLFCRDVNDLLKQMVVRWTCS